MLVFGRSTATIFRALSLATGVLLLAACSVVADDWNRLSDRISGSDSESGSASFKKSKIEFKQFPDLPVPNGAEININETLVFGSNLWFGQLALKTQSNANVIFEFYRRNLPRHHWQEVASVRAPTSVLTYINGDRVLSIAIRDTTLGGADVTLTVSPREASTPSS